jgi:hypothetical protein
MVGRLLQGVKTCPNPRPSRRPDPSVSFSPAVRSRRRAFLYRTLHHVYEISLAPAEVESLQDDRSRASPMVSWGNR